MTILYPPRREQCCGTCRYWQSEHTDDAQHFHEGQKAQGYCRRHAPALVTGDWLFPAIASTQWCGEWAPKEGQ